jgi:1,4-dihydroxy-2-naphthoate polyprenyltransferase
MLRRSTIQLLRIPFSYFLMPVYWFALSMVPNIQWGRAVLIFGLIHLLLYPSSNGYNSYMDRDETPVGGLANPMQPTRQLFWTTVLMDVLGIILSLLVSVPFALAFIIYIFFSRLYSYRGIRLKRFALAGYLTVIVNQGALVFWMVYHGASVDKPVQVPWQGMVVASLLIGGFYPVTQIYQHEADRQDGVNTISMVLGKRGTFIFCAILYAAAFGLLFIHFQQQHQLMHFIILQTFFLPVIVVFFRWMLQVWGNEQLADFRHTMRMNWLASTCTALAFIILLIIQHLG